jgi:hypothetical protein
MGLLEEFIKNYSCPADIFRKIYEYTFFGKKHEVSLLCSHCNICRNSDKKYTQVPLKRDYPLRNYAVNNVLNLFSTPSVMIEFTKDSFEDRLFRRSFHKVFNILVSKGIQNFLFVGNSKYLFLTEKVVNEIKNIPAYLEKVDSLPQLTLAKKRLPFSTSIIFIGFDVKIDETITDLLEIDNNIVVLPRGLADPNTPNRLLSDVYRNQIFQINEFINKVGT